MARRAGSLLSAVIIALTGFVGCMPGDEITDGDDSDLRSTESRTSQGPSRCSRQPVPRKRAGVRAVAFARGRGPVFVGLGTPGIVRYTQDTQEHDGWYYYKTLWAVAPDYGGELTITGRRIDGPESVRFNAAAAFPGPKLKELHFPDSGEGEWRYGSSDTLIHAAGCYAFRIEGDDFVHWVTFIARR